MGGEERRKRNQHCIALLRYFDAEFKKTRYLFIFKISVVLEFCVLKNQLSCLFNLEVSKPHPQRSGSMV